MDVAAHHAQRPDGDIGPQAHIADDDRGRVDPGAGVDARMQGLVGWTWALILAELAPERTDTLLRRGYSFGESRVACGVHWQRAVNAGRMVGAGVVARLHADAGFRTQLDAARTELASARTKGLKPHPDSAAEAAALGVTTAQGR